MFDALAERLEDTWKKLRGQGKISESNVKEAVKEVRKALLEADVNFEVVKSFVAEVEKQALGAEVISGINPRTDRDLLRDNTTSNGIDNNGDELNSIIRITPDGRSLVYTPSPGFLGQESFYYSILHPGSDARDFAMVKVSVFGELNPTIHAINDMTVIGMDDKWKRIAVLVNDIPLGEKPIEIASFTQPDEGGSVSQEGDHLIYTPPDPLITIDNRFTYRITNGEIVSNGATVTIEVVDDTYIGAPDQYALLWAMFAVFIFDPDLNETAIFHPSKYTSKVFQHWPDLFPLIFGPATEPKLRSAGEDLSTSLITRAADEAEPLFMEILNDMIPGIAAVLAGDGSSHIITEEVINKVQDLQALVESEANPQLLDSIREIARSFNNLDDFIGKTYKEGFELLGVNTDSIRIPTLSPQVSEGKFSITTYNASGLRFKLWKSTDLENWQEIETPEYTTDYVYITLTDPDPVTNRIFYRLTNEVDPSEGSTNEEL